MKHIMKTITDELLAFAITLIFVIAFTGIAACMQIPESYFALGLACWLFGREIMKSTREN